MISFFALWLAAEAGALLRETRVKPVEMERDDLELLLNATLTLFALIIGFSFAMATGRFDQRKGLEAEEAVAIGSEYSNIGMLSPGDTARAHELLKSYLGQRILFYTSQDQRQLAQLRSSTSQLQDELLATVQQPATAQPSAIQAFIVKGMHDVVDSQGRAQAAWWNRIPLAAWALMIVVGLCCNVMFGYKANLESRRLLFLALPVIFSVAFFLLADLDSPRAGLIRVSPQNLITLSAWLNKP